MSWAATTPAVAGCLLVSPATFFLFSHLDMPSGPLQDTPMKPCNAARAASPQSASPHPGQSPDSRREERRRPARRILAAAAAIAAALWVCLVPATAQDTAVDAGIEAGLRERLGSPAVGLEVESVAASAIPGIYRVQLRDGPMVYATEDASYFILGDLFSVGPGGFVNLAEQQRSQTRKAKIDAVPAEEEIIFPAKGETLATITVFTDVSCPWCQRLHQEVPELNRRGVEGRYLAYPRQGVGSPGFRQLASAWCARDRQDTLTRLKNRETVPDNVCPGNPVARQFELGREIGVTGTPAIILSSGQLIPGYKKADDLIAMLNIE
jgi:thiol:disulfide interchange protein DsbC